MSFTIGSLFDGSGGFPLAATMCGGTPKWASEVEPYPIAVTKSRFPDMKHLGSVTDINGGEVEPVDVITFGSPCQDLSVAGKRAGLKHTDNGDEETTRSGLFMEAVRIIKEMREATNGAYPRFALWENVPGAFSSNKGEDFRIVLEELIKIVEPTAVMPDVPKNGWPYADSHCGDEWSIAYRVLDAQYWGVPQRRRRIYLVLDLRGKCAREILFEREGLRGYFETGRTPWKAVAGDVKDCAGAADSERKCYGIDHAITTGGNCTAQGPCVYENIQATLKAGGVHAVAYSISCRGSNVEQLIEDKCGTLTAAMNSSRNNRPVVRYPNVVDQHILDDQGVSQISVRNDGKCPTLRAETHGNLPCVLSIENHPADSRVDIDESGNDLHLLPDAPVVFDGANVTPPINASNPQPGDPCNTLSTDNRNYLVEPVYCLQGGGATSQNSQGMGHKTDTSYTLNTTDVHGVAYMTSGKETVGTLMANAGSKLWLGNQEAFSGDYHIIEERGLPIRYIVRRLTPTECARLQSFPDAWGHLDAKTELTDEEYQFWLNVRNTHDAINNKAIKEYTKDQILNWYNKLHTDSSEYKMWGNGIAQPCALYVMQGIAEVLK